MGGASKNKKIRDRVDSEGQHGRWMQWTPGHRLISWTSEETFLDL